MEKVSRMRHCTAGLGCLHRQIVGIHAIRRHNDPPLQLICIGIQSQVHGKLVSTQVGAITHYNKCIHLGVCVEPFVKSSI